MKKHSHGCNFGAPPGDVKKDKDKRHIQSCETGGSIYGKMRTTRDHNPDRSNPADDAGLRGAYSTLYKKQVSALSKLMRRDKK